MGLDLPFAASVQLNQNGRLSIWNTLDVFMNQHSELILKFPSCPLWLCYGLRGVNSYLDVHYYLDNGHFVPILMLLFILSDFLETHNDDVYTFKSTCYVTSHITGNGHISTTYTRKESRNPGFVRTDGQTDHGPQTQGDLNSPPSDDGGLKTTNKRSQRDLGAHHCMCIVWISIVSSFPFFRSQYELS